MSLVIKMKTKKLVISSLFAALTFVATMIIQIKLTANGFVNIGDCMVVCCGIFLGPVYGMLAAGIGSMLADVIGGYFIYAPATLIIKSLMAFFTAITFKKITKINDIVAVGICTLIAELIMILGYFLYEIPLYGIVSAVAGMPGNLMQAGFGFVCSIVLYIALSKNKYIKNQIRC